MQGIQRIADKGFVYPSSCSFLYRMAEEESKSLQRHLDNLSYFRHSIKTHEQQRQQQLHHFIK